MLGVFLHIRRVYGEFEEVSKGFQLGFMYVKADLRIFQKCFR